jgi:hypothetical protein
VLQKQEDRSGDGKPDLSAWFEKGRVVRLEQDTNGSGCPDLKQWFDANEKVRAEYKDTTGDCKTDVWTYFDKGRLVREGQDSQGNGRPDLLNHFDAKGNAVAQEVASDGRNPDKKFLLGPGGVVKAQCTLSEDGKKLNTRAVVDRQGNVLEVLTDTTGNGVADQRIVYRGGEAVRLDADTNADRKPDVAQHYAGGQVTHQDEDVDFDGVIDRRFRGDQPAEVPAGTAMPGESFGKLGCGSFHRFWWKR